jgi:arsenate reductase (glutaredoxin)
MAIVLSLIKVPLRARKGTLADVSISPAHLLPYWSANKEHSIMSMTLYHNPRCSKSRQALALLQEHGFEPTVVRYLETPLDAESLRILLQLLSISARDLLRTGEEEYKALNLADYSLSEQVLVDAMAAHPKLMERPVFVSGSRAVIGRPPERVLELINP